jgi:hypothetical protein
MKQNSAEQPYEAVTRLVDRLREIELIIKELNVGNQNYGFKIVFKSASNFIRIKKTEIDLNKEVRLELIEVLESKKQQIENELNKLLNGN